MEEKNVTVSNPTGLHARPASLLIQQANRFQSTITIIKGEQTVDGKSLLGLMSLAVKKNDSITIRAEGSDEQEAVDTLVTFIQDLKE